MFIYEMKVKKIEAAACDKLISRIFWIILNVYIQNMSAALCSSEEM